MTKWKKWVKNINIQNKIAFVDLDGTLINVQERLYRLFVKLANVPEVPFEEYWRLKNQGFLQHDMLKRVGFPEDKIDEFRHNWLFEIEKKEWLSYDFKQPGVEGFLQKLSEQFRLALWTNRQSKENVLWELERLGLIQWFPQILITERKCTKKELLDSVKKNTVECIVIGDTVEDKIAAEECGIKFYKYNTDDKAAGYEIILKNIRDSSERESYEYIRECREEN